MAFILVVEVLATLIAVRPAVSATIYPQWFGAKGDGVSDDTPALQIAINALVARGGGVLHFPSGTYLLNSYTTSPHPWFFHNLIVGSNIVLEGEPGAKLLQGPNGRAHLPPGATEVETAVLVFGAAKYVLNTFQTAGLNGGFYPLNATTANDVQVTLTTPADAVHFVVDDYVGVYSATSGDVIPGETSQVASVNIITGVIGLRSHLARSFTTPSIANVTALATTAVGVKRLTIQGTRPLVVHETFHFIAEDCHFISDTSVGGSNDVGFNLNTMRDFQFIRNTISSVGPTVISIELPQRNSQDGLFQDNTFRVGSVGFGEYGAHWKFVGNHIYLFPTVTTGVGITLGGLDVMFDHNDVHSGNITASGGALLADQTGPDAYAAFIGQLRITNNTFECQADGNNCLHLLGPDPIVSHNHLLAKGNTVGIKIEGSIIQFAHVTDNDVSIGSGDAVVLNTTKTDHVTVSGNTLVAIAGGAGIRVTSPAVPNTDGHILVGNTIKGFITPIAIDLTKHPGTRVDAVP